MPVGKPQVERTAKLACLKLSPDEIDHFARDLSAIVDYFEKLSDVDTSTVELRSDGDSLSDALRDDRVSDSLPRDKSLGNASEQDGEYFLVPKVIG